MSAVKQSKKTLKAYTLWSFEMLSAQEDDSTTVRQTVANDSPSDKCHTPEYFGSQVWKQDIITAVWKLTEDVLST